MVMRKILFCLCAILLLQSIRANAQGRDIKITIPKMANKDVILAHYFEGKVYASDTAKLDASGSGAFKSKNKLGKGMYLILFSPSNYFDILIGDNQNFSVKTDTIDVINRIQIEGSPENLAFLDFQKFMMTQNKKTRQISEEYEKDPNKEKNKQQYIDRFDQAGVEVRNYIDNLNKKYPGSALATFATFTQTTPTPDFSKEVPEGTKDRDLEIQRKAYYFNKAHYWDYTNFKDSTLIRTPIFKDKIDNYFNNMILMHPDSVFKESVGIIERSKGSRAMYRYLVSYCYNFTLESKIMGMDAAFVKLAKRYYLSGQVDWVDKESLKKIEREVLLTQYNLIGETAPELKLQTLEGGWVSLHETKAPFTLLLFWEENCGHCKKQVPLVKTQLMDKFKPYGFKVFAVHTQAEKEKWEKFVTEHELFDFINCWDAHDQSNFRAYYHVDSTPVLYLLDKNKKIIAKKLDNEQLIDMLVREYKKMGIDVK